MELMYVTHQLHNLLAYIHGKLKRRSYKQQGAQAVIIVHLDRISVASPLFLYAYLYLLQPIRKLG